MAIYIKSKISIDGQDFLPSVGYEIVIKQKMLEHHSFTVSFPTEATETGGGLMDESMRYVGKKISISINDGTMEFVGLITNIALTKNDGSNGNIVLSGYSPTILMGQTVQSNSFDEGTSFDQIISDTTIEYPTDLIRVSIATNLKVPYTVQYNESDFDFLKRMSARYGLWFFYDGNEVVVGEIGAVINTGVYGHNIPSFNLGVQLQEQQFEIKSHDWMANTVLEATSDAFSSATSHTYANTLKEESDAVYRKKGTLNYLHAQNDYSGQKGINDATEIRVLSKAANMIVASGVSELPELRVGNILTVEGINFEDASKLDALGSYIVTEITHTFNHAGHYHNTWQGVPEGTTHPQYSNIFTIPTAETQRAVVKENVDPDGLGRVKVQFPWQKEAGTMTPWIKVNTPYAGPKRGFYFVPELEDEVLIGFEADNAERPFVQSTAYNNKAKSGHDTTDNNIKAIVTRSGHTIQFDDTDGAEKISIFDKESKNVIVLNSATEELQIISEGNINMQGKNISITAKESVNIEAQEKELSLLAKKSVAVESSADKITLKATKEVLTEGQKVNIKAQTKVSVAGNAGVDVKSPANTIQGNVSKLQIV